MTVTGDAAAMGALEGIVAILPTPLAPDGAPDLAGLAHLVRHCVDAGLDGAVVLGSNGEFPYLDFDARRRVMAAAAEAAEGHIPVIGTASAAGTEEAVALARAARQAGCAAVLATIPTYWRVEADEAYDHLEAVAAAAGEGGLPVYFYYFPEVTGLVLSPAAIARIAALDGVVGAKITVSNARFLRRVIAATRPHGFRVFTGTSFLAEACLAAGGAGVFCPLPLLVPEPTKALFRAARAGDAAEARRLQARLRRAVPLFSGIAAFPTLQARAFGWLAAAPYRGPGRRPAPTHGLLKEALRQRGHPIGPTVRRPHRPPSPAQRELVRRTLARLDGD